MATIRECKNKPTLVPGLLHFYWSEVMLHDPASEAHAGSHPSGTPVAKPQSDQRASHLLSLAREGTAER